MPQPEKARSQLTMIDFFGPDLTTHLPALNYTLKYGVSGYAKAGKTLDETGQEGVYTSVQVGDDAYFLRNDSLGVSDGVGGKQHL